MKNFRLLTFVLLFTGFLLPGFWFGRKVGNQAKEPQKLIQDQVIVASYFATDPIDGLEDSLVNMTTPPVPSTSANTDRPGNIQQRNLLVIGVDDIDSETPGLNSVWLIIFMPNTPHFMLLPIYPNGTLADTNQPSTIGSLVEAFHLDRGKTPHDSFFKALEAKEIWWHAYVLLDETALLEISNFVGLNSEDSDPHSSHDFNNAPSPEDDPLGSLLGQAEFVQSLCKRTTHLSAVDRSQYLKFLTKVGGHMRSDLDLETTITEWQQLLKQGGNITCEFPSLAAPNFNP